MDSPVLECRQLIKRYDQKTIFQAADLSLNMGEILSVIGPSGCGKTTLLRCIAGLEEVTEGKIYLNGQDITGMKAEERPIVMMFQQPLLFPHLTVLENITYGLKFKRTDKKAQAAMGKDFLHKIELADYSEAYPYALSGGQQQRVALARALITKPEVLLLDEPFSSLDPELRRSIRGWVSSLLREQKVTALFVTHDREEAMTFGHRVVVMHDGVIQQIGLPMEVYQQPKNIIVADFFSEGLVLDDKTFVPVNNIKLIPVEDAYLLSSKFSFFEGIITGKMFRFGRLIYQVKLSSLGKEITVPTKQEFAIDQQVILYFPQDGITLFSK